MADDNNNIHVFVAHFAIFLWWWGICVYGYLFVFIVVCCLVLLVVVCGACVGCFSFRTMTDLLYKLLCLDKPTCLCYSISSFNANNATIIIITNHTASYCPSRSTYGQ